MTEHVALVTGGSRGIGAAIAKYLAAQEIKVVVGYRSKRQMAEDVVDDIQRKGGAAVVQEVDVVDRASIRDAISAANGTFGVVDVLVNNAAVAQEKPFLDITDEDWDEVLAANLRGAFACSQEVLPAMIEHGWGRIVNIASIGGQWGGINQIHYACAKAGLIGLTRSLAKTFSGHGLTVNAVSPGLVDTDMTRGELSTAAGQDKARAVPSGRVGRVEDVAAAVSYLVSPGADYITGQTINVNGGMYFG